MNFILFFCCFNLHLYFVLGQGCSGFSTTSPFIDDAAASTGYISACNDNCNIFAETLCSTISPGDGSFWSNGLPINSSNTLNCNCVINPQELDFFYTFLQNTSLQFAGSGCSYFRGSIYNGLDECLIVPVPLNEFGQTLYLVGYNLSIFGYFEYYPQLVYPSWGTRIDTCLVTPLYSAQKSKIFTQNLFVSQAPFVLPRFYLVLFSLLLSMLI